MHACNMFWCFAIASHGGSHLPSRLPLRHPILPLCLTPCCPQHPGFDFSSAEFTGGSVPDPRTFMRDLDRQ